MDETDKDRREKDRKDKKKSGGFGGAAQEGATAMPGSKPTPEAGRGKARGGKAGGGKARGERMEVETVFNGASITFKGSPDGLVEALRRLTCQPKIDPLVGGGESRKKKERLRKVNPHDIVVQVPEKVKNPPNGWKMVSTPKAKYVVFEELSEVDDAFKEHCLSCHASHILTTKAPPAKGSEAMTKACIQHHYLEWAKAYSLSVEGTLVRGLDKIRVLQFLYPILGRRFLDEPAELSQQVMQCDAEAEHQPPQVMPGGDEAKPKPKDAGGKKRAVVQSDSDSSDSAESESDSD